MTVIVDDQHAAIGKPGIQATKGDDGGIVPVGIKTKQRQSLRLINQDCFFDHALDEDQPIRWIAR